MVKKLLLIAGVIGVIGVAAGSQFLGQESAAVEPTGYTFTGVKKASLKQVVSASGAVRPLVTVDIGSQLSGQVSEINVDFNDQVKAGQLLARIDPQTFATRVRQSEADLKVAEANIEVQKANVKRAQARLAQAKRDVVRQEALAKDGNLSVAALDNTVTLRETAIADLAAAKAQLQNAEAVKAQREASLEQNRIDLTRSEIRSPIDGVVISRDVDIGQTVAASFSAPLLFQLAQDLTDIQIEASVDEADIGSVRAGNTVQFTVDAYPTQSFSGKVDVVRLSPTELQNVVTYTVIITAKNPDRRLLPGMTANVDIITGARDDVLTVSNAALRFRPRGVDVDAAVEAARQAQREAAQARRRQAGQAAGGNGRGNGRGGRGAAMARQLEELQEKLALTDDQLKAIKQSSAVAGRQMRTLFTSGMPRDEMRAAIGKLFRDAITQHLTIEQKQQYAVIEAERARIRQAPLWVVNPKTGEPEVKLVMVGLDDGQNTEIVRGIEEGVEVIERQKRGNR